MFQALIVILMGFFLNLKLKKENSNFFFVVIGFLLIGILMFFHAIASEGSNGCVLFHSLESLLGGISFALIWAPKYLLVKM